MNFNLTIKNKLIAGFSLILIGVIVLGMSSLNNMETLSQLTAKMYKHPLTVTEASLKADVAMIKIHRSMKDVALAKDIQGIENATKNIDLYEKEALKELNIVKEFILGKEGEDLIARTIITFNNWQPIRQEAINLMKQGDSHSAAMITKEKGAIHVKKLAKEMVELSDYAGTKADGFNNNAKNVYKDAVTWMLCVVALLFIFSFTIAFILIKHITQPLTSLQSTIESIEQNSDLTNKASVHREDEFGAIAKSFNAMISTFKDAIGNVSSSSEEVSEAASHSATLNETTRENITAQNDQLQQLATSIEEMSASIAEVAQNTTLAASSSEEADRETVQGAKLVQQTFNSVNEVNIEISGVGESVKKLEVQGKNVTSVLEVIKSIAEQTNLLALNAAIEAARAGEQGRGFAVVADEVRALAKRTQDSTAEIESMLNQFNGEIDHAVLAIISGQNKMDICVVQAQEATQSIDNITKSVDTIKETSYQIASAAEEQSMVTGEITTYIASISDASTNTLNAAIESSSAITQQAKMAEELKTLSNKFTYC